uniref:DNA polymerase delta subunit 3 n=1 Tax=Glossina pallidipes TaxID=7398 RepID=A0A1A9Z215_GLOPL
MSRMELEKDLKNSIINFDRRVLITELLELYELELEDIQEILLLYLKEQEQINGSKYDKRFAVWAEEQLNEDDIREVCKIVEESKLAECKLQKLESMLYSVEILGGAKSAGAIFKPMAIAKDAKLKQMPKQQTNGSSTLEKNSTRKDLVRNKVHENIETVCKTEDRLNDNDEKSTTSGKVSKTSPAESQTNSIDKRTSNKNSPTKLIKNQKGINTYFTNGLPKKKSDDSKSMKKLEVAPKKKQDFFKKQEEKPCSFNNITREAPFNASIQLLEEEVDGEDDAEQIESSDEEEKLEALKRDIISSDVELEDKAAHASSSCKRRRIIDSDDEEDERPPEKQGKLEDTKKEEDLKPQTFLDDDGFVITVKPKSGNKSLVKSKTISSPESKKPKIQNGKKSTISVNTQVKSKQSGIKNYFGKK